MEDFLNSLTSTPALALGAAIVIFVVTVVLLIKRLIGFFITLLLLFFAIVSGYAILNHDIVRNYLRSLQTEKTPPPSSTPREHEEPKPEEQNLKKTLMNAYEELKEKIDSLIHKSENEPEKNQPEHRQEQRLEQYPRNNRFKSQ